MVISGHISPKKEAADAASGALKMVGNANK
jgi:hypothetical protein